MATSFKTSRAWLQEYFSEELPSGEALADVLTFHVVEVDGVEDKDGDQILDTPLHDLGVSSPAAEQITLRASRELCKRHAEVFRS